MSFWSLLGVVSTNKRKLDQDDDAKSAPVDVKIVSWDQLKNDPVLTKLNPQRRLPFFFDPTKDDLSLNESGGLVEYLLEEYDPDNTLHPAPGDKTRPEFLKLIHFGPATAYHIGVHLLFLGTDKDFEEKKKGWHEVVAPTLKMALNKYGGPYLLGEEFTAADAVLGYDIVTVASAKCADEMFEKHPELRAYHQTLKSRAAFQEVYSPKEDE